MFKLIRRSTEFIKPEYLSAVGIVALTIAVTGLGVAEPLVIKYIFDALHSAHALHGFTVGISTLLVLEVSRALLNGWISVKTWNVRLRVDFRLRERLFGKICALPLDYHRNESVGGNLNRVNQSIQGYLHTFSNVVYGILPSLIFLVLSVGTMVYLDWRLSAVVLLFVPLPTLIGAWAAREQATRERLLLEKWSGIYARLTEVLTGIATVKSFAREQGEMERFLQQQTVGNEIVRAGVYRDTLTGGIRNFSATLARLVALGVGGYFVTRGEITVGTLIAFLSYIGSLFGPVQGLTGIYQTLRKGVVSLEVIYSVLDAEDTVADASEGLISTPLAGSVSFRGVHFSYPDGTVALREFNLEVSPGETIALVGPSGAGKSTVAQLLQRHYDVTAGIILVDGHDLRVFSKTSLRQQIGMVLQEIHLFNDTIHANIGYGRPSATRAEIRAAARAAQADDFISALPQGYDTVLGERGSRLSGGQRQRIAIARALLINPPILILDEATSALDVESEGRVQQALEVLLRGRTTFVIAHRLSTVVGADRIIVICDGRIEATGNHGELLAQGGTYAKLVQMQTGGFLPENHVLEIAA